jgi:hypothetical protein
MLKGRRAKLRRPSRASSVRARNHAVGCGYLTARAVVARSDRSRTGSRHARTHSSDRAKAHTGDTAGGRSAGTCCGGRTSASTRCTGSRSARSSSARSGSRSGSGSRPCARTGSAAAGSSTRPCGRLGQQGVRLSKRFRSPISNLNGRALDGNRLRRFDRSLHGRCRQHGGHSLTGDENRACRGDDDDLAHAMPLSLTVEVVTYGSGRAQPQV